MELATDLPEKEVCPNCGHWGTLVENTGWCAQCTLAHDPDILICSCGALYPKSAQVSKCWACRKEEWLGKHADQIEQYLIAGMSYTAATKQVADDIRPTCYSCGDPIKGGREGSKFCRKNAECEKKAIKYTTLRQAGLSPDVALAIAIGRVTVLDSN